MEKHEETPKSWPRWAKIALWGLVCVGGPVLIAIVFLVIVSARVNSAGRIPDSMRTPPAEIVAFHHAPPPTAVPVNATGSHHDTPPSKAKTSPKSRLFDVIEWSSDFDVQFNDAGPGIPITSKQSEWLRANSDLVTELHTLVNQDKKTFTAQMHFGEYVYFTFNKLLVVAAQNAMEQGDTAAAHECLLDSLKFLGLSYGLGTSRATMMTMLASQNCSLVFWAVENNQCPNDQWAGIPEALETLDTLIFDSPAVERELVNEYLKEREAFIEKLDGPWNSPVYGWQISDAEYFWPTDLYLRHGRELRLPRVTKFLATASLAMANKRRSAEFLKEFDVQQIDLMKQFRLTYPEALARRKDSGNASAQSGPVREYIHLYSAVPAARQSAAYFVLQENTLHLARVGLLWRLDHEKARALRDQNMRDHPHNPWRDPFSEKPYLLEQTTTGTLIYSVGFSNDPGYTGGLAAMRRARNMHVFVPGETAAPGE